MVLNERSNMKFHSPLYSSECGFNYAYLITAFGV